MMTMEQHREALTRQMVANGGRLPQAPDGPVLEDFKAMDLAQALEHELIRLAQVGNAKIRIDMNPVDAQALASFLRRAALLGV